MMLYYALILLTRGAGCRHPRPDRDSRGGRADLLDPVRDRDRVIDHSPGEGARTAGRMTSPGTHRQYGWRSPSRSACAGRPPPEVNGGPGDLICSQSRATMEVAHANQSQFAATDGPNCRHPHSHHAQVTQLHRCRLSHCCRCDGLGALASKAMRMAPQRGRVPPQATSRDGRPRATKAHPTLTPPDL